MKKTIYCAFCTAAVLVSCAKEVELNQSPKDTSNESKTELEAVTIIATTPTTKTTVDALGAYSWADDETISVADGTDAPKTFTVDNNNKDKGYFTGSKSGDLRYAVSPKGVLPTTLLYNSGTEDLLNLPSDYDYVEGRTNSIMIAGAPTVEGDKYQFAFRHVGALMKYTVENVPIRTKYFKLTTDQNIAGDDIVFDASTVTEVSTSDVTTNASKSITVTLPKAVSKANQTMSFYIPVPTGTYKTVKAQLCMANDDVLAEKNKSMSGGLELNRTDIFVAPIISLGAAAITKGNEYKFEFGGAKKFNNWGDNVTQNSMTWTLEKVTAEASASPGSWDGNSDRGQQVGTGSTGSKVTTVSLKAVGYADYCESSTAVGINEVYVKAGAKNGTKITCTVSVGGVAMSAKSSGSDSYTAAEGNPGTMTFSSGSLLTGDIEITYTLNTPGALYINDVTINADNRTPVTLSFDNDAISDQTTVSHSFTGQAINSSVDVSAVTNNISWSITGDAITSSFNTSSGALVLNGSAGTATVKATFAGDENYKSANASYSITVSKVKLATPTTPVNAAKSGDDAIVVTLPTGVSNVGSYSVTCTGETTQVVASGTSNVTFSSLSAGSYTVTVTAIPSNTSVYDNSDAWSSSSITIGDDPVALYTATFEGDGERQTDTGNNNYTGTNVYTVSGVSWTLNYADAVSNANRLDGDGDIMARIAKNANTQPTAETANILSAEKNITKITFLSKLSNMTLAVQYHDGTSWETITPSKDTSVDATYGYSYTFETPITVTTFKLKFTWTRSSGTARIDSQLDDITVIGY